ncbi:SagB family peptide dehydrogenase [Rhizobium leguminosarum]|uniref:SagB family peptide dehydrogenase n=1 Tax=Rhizobium leguminosarum TaxID=384 RepID=UPI000DE4C738|nr:SagB family peptide dehydrogenase [Rhizobium leguminosarum]TCA08602.1 SagB/ThcOx family dehydrogenase [Rhizobium leguminosarum bv. viciae]
MSLPFNAYCFDRTRVRLRKGVSLDRDEGLGTNTIRARNLEFPLQDRNGLLEFAALLADGVGLAQALSLTSANERALALFKGILMRGFAEYAMYYAPDEYIRVIPNTGDYIPEFPAEPPHAQYALVPDAFLKRAGNEWVLLAPKCRAEVLFPFPSGFEMLSGLAEGGSPPCEHSGRALVYATLASLGLIETRFGDAESQPQTGLQFHELLFHRLSRKGDHGQASGATFAGLPKGGENPFSTRVWKAGQPIILPDVPPIEKPYGKSIREFSDRPISLSQLGRLLSMTVMATDSTTNLIDGVPIEVPQKPYPSGGGLYEIEVYLAAYNVAGLPVGFYHYNSTKHCLSTVSNDEAKLRRLAIISRTTMGARSDPATVIVLSARFQRMTWKYRSLTYSVILKNVGVLMKTIYDALPGCGLGGCALGSGNIDLFEELTGLDWLEESSVGEFVIGVPEQPQEREKG